MSFMASLTFITRNMHKQFLMLQQVVSIITTGL